MAKIVVFCNSEMIILNEKNLFWVGNYKGEKDGSWFVICDL